MDDDDNKHVTQTELLRDVIFDDSMALRPPPRPKKPARPRPYAPDYDPDTIDLFGDINEAETNPADETDDTPNEPAEPLLSDDLRREITSDLGDILQQLKD